MYDLHCGTHLLRLVRDGAERRAGGKTPALPSRYYLAKGTGVAGAPVQKPLGAMGAARCSVRLSTVPHPWGTSKVPGCHAEPGAVQRRRGISRCTDRSGDSIAHWRTLSSEHSEQRAARPYTPTTTAPTAVGNPACCVDIRRLPSHMHALASSASPGTEGRGTLPLKKELG